MVPISASNDSLWLWFDVKLGRFLVNLAETAYQMPTGVLLHEAGKQFAMAEIVRDGWQQVLYERGGWFLLIVYAERTDGVAWPPGNTFPPSPTDEGADR